MGALASLAAAANGLYFSIEGLTATDKYDPASTSVDFTVSDPTAFPEQGGVEPGSCSIAWNAPNTVPTCWSQCTNNGYYARITAGTYASAANFSLDIWQAFVYELANHNSATVPIAFADCYTDAACEVCTESGSAFNQTLTTYYAGSDPTGAIC
ncbi:hypothetical protein LTR08_007722 [Meristemomyces frigidus]|nr:hypothetical protein LTR08_007722 [Meristemomyces frigidus]